MAKKLVIANNQRPDFVEFHAALQDGRDIYDYVGYRSLLFEFDTDINLSHFWNVETGARSDEYGGVYLNGYLSTVEIATTAATVLDTQSIAYVNRELATAPSLSKLSSYAKLAGAGVSMPHTFGGAAYALLAGFTQHRITLQAPFVLKRADADRGIDNYKVDSYDQAIKLLQGQDERSLWVAQAFVPNDGFYLVSIYHDQPEFTIYRAMGERADGRSDKAHMFKPKGGVNASLIDITDTPQQVVDISLAAAKAMNRQIASVDSLYNPATGNVYVLEVNYNPQLVTITTFKDVRREAFLRAVQQIGE
ncbi:MAG: hypothetical protein WAS27_01165 [Candidatus Saccharimonadales bacterium]